MSSQHTKLSIQENVIKKYTTVSGVDGFDGTRKEAPKAVVKAIV
jgi:thioredoxin reductase (NADPH)